MASASVSGAAAAVGFMPRGEAGRVDALMNCLRIVAQFHGRIIGADEIRRQCPIPADGMTPNEFLLAADRLGFKASRRGGLRASDFAAIPTPFVWLDETNGTIQLVFDRDDDFLTVVDPTTGARRHCHLDSLAATEASVILVKPSRCTAATDDWRAMLRDRTRGAIRELLLASLLINLFVLAPPLFLMTVFNKVIGHGALDTLHILMVGMLAVYGFDVLLKGIRGYISSHTTARLDALIGAEVVRRMLRLPLQHFETTSVGVIHERLRQLDVIHGFLTGQMPLVLIDLVFIVLFLGVLFAISAQIALVTAAVIPVFVLVSLVYHRTQQKYVEEGFWSRAAKTSALSESVNNIVTVKSLGLEVEAARRWNDRLAFSAATGFRAGTMSNVITAVGGGLQQVALLAIIYLGAVAVMAGEMSIGALIAANILAARVLGPARKVVSAWAQLQEARAAFGRLDELVAAGSAADENRRTAAPRLTGAITLENVSMRMAADRPNVLENVNLDVRPGEILVVMGPSGAGKTTLLRMLQGLYAPTGGRVVLDGTDIAHIPDAQLRAQIAVVPQDIQLFSGSVRDNISIGTPGADPNRIVAAAKFAGAHDFISRLPQGYDTVLGESAAALSAGQKQLICVARAVFRNPRILILDEATSALDGEVEKQLIANLERVKKGRTVIVVSHRPAVLAVADKVAHVGDGTVTVSDPPRSLVEVARRSAGNSSVVRLRPTG